VRGNYAAVRRRARPLPSSSSAPSPDQGVEDKRLVRALPGAWARRAPACHVRLGPPSHRPLSGRRGRSAGPAPRCPGEEGSTTTPCRRFASLWTRRSSSVPTVRSPLREVDANDYTLREARLRWPGRRTPRCQPVNQFEAQSTVPKVVTAVFTSTGGAPSRSGMRSTEENCPPPASWR